MHSFVYRVNALLTFAGSVLAMLCIMATITDYFNNPQLEVDCKITKVERLFRSNQGNDEALLGLAINADLNPLFSWNTKEVFVFVSAEYRTKTNHINQVSLWDRIINFGEDPIIHLPYVRSKYKLVDQGHHLRGSSINVTLHWNTIPFTGRMRTGSVVFPNQMLPANYTRNVPGGGWNPMSNTDFRQRFVEGDLHTH